MGVRERRETRRPGERALSRRIGLAAGAALFLLTVIAHLPAFQGGFVWDDNAHVTENRTLRSLDGLGRIWLDPQATPQYYPLVHTTFWVEHRLWGNDPTGYHVVNVILHALSAFLAWCVLRSLGVPGAWWIAAIFGIHPVQVESVAWITERKNVLSGFLYFCSLAAYLRFRPPGGTAPSSHARRWYAASFLLFAGALLSKTVTCTFPAVVLLIVWWKQGRVTRRDALPLLPFFFLGAGGGMLTAWLEKHHVGAAGPDWDLSVIQRVLLAGRAVWFYAAKLVWPSRLTFVYPRWTIDAGMWWQYLFPLAALAALLTLWRVRRRLGNGPLAATLMFIGTLAPALGFVDVFPMRYSYVADHFQYLASLGVITLIVGSVATAFRRAGTGPGDGHGAGTGAKAGSGGRATNRRGAVLTRAGVITGIVALAALVPSTWRQARAYRNLETLWNDTLAKNPGAWMAHNNLGSLLSRRGDWAGAQRRFEEVLRLKPNDPEALNNLGFALYKQGRPEEAIRRYEAALASKRESADVQNNWGQALVALGRYDEAASRYQEALRIRPQHPEALSNYGALLLDHLKQPQEAATRLRRALAARPDFAEAHLNYALALIALGEAGEAERELREALRLHPRLPAAHHRLGQLLAGRQAYDEAIAEHRTALALRPNWIEAMRDLAWLLATSPEARLRDDAEAVALAEQICRPSALPADPGRQAACFDVLGAAYARTGRFAQAVGAAERAIELLQAQPQHPRRAEIEARLRLYREGQPYPAGPGP